MSQIIMRESEGIFGIFNEKVNEINDIDFSKDEFVLVITLTTFKFCTWFEVQPK